LTPSFCSSRGTCLVPQVNDESIRRPSLQRFFPFVNFKRSFDVSNDTLEKHKESEVFGDLG